MADAQYTPRLKGDYQARIRQAMTEKFGYTNEMQVPKLDKIVLNMGIGEAVADSKKAIKANKPPSKVGRTALKIGAAGVAAYGAYKGLRALHDMGKKHEMHGHTMNFGKHAGKLISAASAAANSGPGRQASFTHGGMYGNLKHEALRVARPVSFGT